MIKVIALTIVVEIMSESESLAGLSNQELLRVLKSRRANLIAIFVISFLMYVYSIYESVINGFGFYTFFPLIFAGILAKTWKSYKKSKEECKRRDIS